MQKAIDEGKLDAKNVITVDTLTQAGLFKRGHDGLRVLAEGKITAKVMIEAVGASKAAIAAVEKAGGSIKLAEEKGAEKAKPAKKQ